jgi:hypothetical protein
MMEAVSTSETPVNFYQTTRLNIPEDCHLRIHFVEISGSQAASMKGDNPDDGGSKYL